MFLVCMHTRVSAQNFVGKKDSIINNTIVSKKNLYPIFLPHLGVGLASGTRLGLWVQATENFSAEVSAGYDLANFTSASDEEKRYGIGISYRYSEKTPVFLSLLYVVGIRGETLNARSPKYYYSLNAGYISLKKSGFNFFARGGIILKYFNERSLDKIEYEKTFFNLDIGFGYSF